MEAISDLIPKHWRPWSEWKPLGEWVMVKADPRVKKTAGGIYLPDELLGIERVMEGTGHILKVGTRAPKAANAGLEAGMRIAYRGFLKDVTQDLFSPIDDCPVFLLNAKDITAIIDESVKLGYIR